MKPQGRHVGLHYCLFPSTRSPINSTAKQSKAGACYTCYNRKKTLRFCSTKLWVSCTQAIRRKNRLLGWWLLMHSELGATKPECLFPGGPVSVRILHSAHEIAPSLLAAKKKWAISIWLYLLIWFNMKLINDKKNIIQAKYYENRCNSKSNADGVSFAKMHLNGAEYCIPSVLVLLVIRCPSSGQFRGWLWWTDVVPER